MFVTGSSRHLCVSLVELSGAQNVADKQSSIFPILPNVCSPSTLRLLGNVTPFSHDPSRSVIAHHYCTHLHGKNMHQCLIFDSDTPGARLIGIEYVIPEETFVGLPDEEKKFWHSHKFGELNVSGGRVCADSLRGDVEVESGMLQLGMKTLVPSTSHPFRPTCFLFVFLISP